jgi:tetratricopeptide (TPR) repeat protein
LRALLQRVDDPSLCAALGRIERALRYLSLDEAEEGRGQDERGAENEFADLDLLEALRQGSDTARSTALGRLAPRIRTEQLRTSVNIARDVAAWAAGQDPSSLAADMASESPAAGALAALLGIDCTWESDSAVLAPEIDPSAALRASMSSGNLGQMADDFCELRQRISEPEDRWAMAVAEACARLHGLGQPRNALAALQSEEFSPVREPFASLVRLVDRAPTALSKLAESQADAMESPQTKATCLAWAAFHLESVDRARALELYENATQLDGSCLMALCGLERVGANPEELARLWTSAAEIGPVSRSISSLVRASYWHRMNAGHSRAAALLLKAYRSVPSEVGLWEMAFKAASTHMRSALSSHVLAPPSDHLAPHERFALGSLALEIAPDKAASWLLSAKQEQVEDAIYRLGLEEALLETGQAEVLMSNLADELQNSEGEAVARGAVRLALASQRRGQGSAELLRHWGEVWRRVPQCPSVALKRVIAAGMERDTVELAQAYRELACCTQEPTMAIAAAVAAWQVQPEDLASLELASRLDERCALAHVELEARLEDHLSDARAPVLERVLRLLPNNVSYWMRQAELCRGKDSAAAAQAYGRAKDASADDPLPVARLISLSEDGDDGLNALVELPHRCQAPAHKQGLLRAAALLASGQPERKNMAGRLWADLLVEVPGDEEAFSRASSLAEELGDTELLCKVLTARLQAGLDPEETRQIHLQLVDPNLELCDRDAAKEHLGKAAELMVNDLDTHFRLAQLHREDGEWHLAIERLMISARLVRNPENGIPVFFALGELYMDHSPRTDLAEKSFMKVLGWNVEHVPSLERLAELYRQSGDFGRATQALEHLVRLSANPHERVDRSLALARLLDEELGRPGDAERVLWHSWESNFSDLRPIEELSRLFERRLDSLSLNVLVDRGVAAHLASPEPLCEDVEALARVARLYEIRGQSGMAAIAMQAREMASGCEGQSEAAQWNLGARLADSAFEEMICPKDLTSALRALLGAVEEPLAKALGVWVKQVDFGGETKLRRKDALSVSVARVAQLFGVDTPVVYSSSEPSLRIYPGSPGAVVVPRTVVESDSQSIFEFVAASASHALRHGLALSTVVSADTLQEALFTVLGLVAPGAAPPAASPLASRISEVMTTKIKSQIRPFVLDAVDILSVSDFPLLMREAIDRAGLLGSGSLLEAAKTLRLLCGQTDASLRDLPGYPALLAFCLSKVHLDLREAMGI